MVAPVGTGWDHQAYNVNADEAAAALAAGLKAEKFVLVTDVPGILIRREDHPTTCLRPKGPSAKGGAAFGGKGRWWGDRTLLSTLTVPQARRLIQREVISGGMIPKAKACIHALQGGVRKTHMIHAAVPLALLLEIFTDRGIGTEIVKK